MSRGLDLDTVDGFESDEHRKLVAAELRRRMPTFEGVLPASSFNLDDLSSRRDVGRVIGLGADRPSHMRPTNRISVAQEGALENGLRAIEG
jgi:hypothetical protein